MNTKLKVHFEMLHMGFGFRDSLWFRVLGFGFWV